MALGVFFKLKVGKLPLLEFFFKSKVVILPGGTVNFFLIEYLVLNVILNLLTNSNLIF